MVSEKGKQFPFMEKSDIFIGPVSTNVDYRRQNIMAYIVSKMYNQNDSINYWWVVHQDNIGSIKLAEKLGFTLYGEGIRTRMKKFVITKKFCD